MYGTETAIVIPVYRLSLTENERKSLAQINRIMSSRTIILAIPEGLDVQEILVMYPRFKTECFHPAYFDGIRGYNRLVLSEVFYKRFAAYGYILIYQLDAYVFSDDLDKWTEAGYDYVGAPWLPDKKKYLSIYGRIQLWINRFTKRNNGLNPHGTHFYNVGNGGLSLRKVDTFIYITRKYREKISRDLGNDSPFYPEDMWLFFELDRNVLKKPAWRKALTFAFEMNPDTAYRLNGRKLPSGCHAWTLPSYFRFWKKYIY